MGHIEASDCKLLIAAASDLTDAQADLGGLLPGCHVRFTFAASGLLQQQIQNGAPYDVFLSANRLYVNNLAAKGLVDEAASKVFGYGQLALWSKNGVHWKDLGDERVKRIAIANPALAPYGRAAEEALQKDQKLWKLVQPKLVFGENARQALQYAETGNADACLVSYSLLQNRGAELVDSTSYGKIEQTAAVIRRSVGSTPNAERFLVELMGPRGQSVVRKHGLLPVSGQGTGQPSPPHR